MHKVNRFEKTIFNGSKSI